MSQLMFVITINNIINSVNSIYSTLPNVLKEVFLLTKAVFI